MKRLICLMSILFLMLQSCSSGDNSSSDNSSNDINSLLLKKWYLVSQTSGGKTYYNTPCSNGNRFYIEFISPSIYNEYHYNSTSDCNYSVEGPYKWVKNGDNIDFSSNGTIYFTATISELTVTTLKMVVTDSGHSSLCVYNSY
jgi:hypothetical protein